MRAAVLHEYGEPPELGEFDEPTGGYGRLVLDVLAAGLNPIDVRTASGALADHRPPLPSVVGAEGIGRTEDGRRVYFGACIRPWGSLAERTVAEAHEIAEVPDGVEDAHAVCYGIAGIAAWLALERRAQLRPGETVLVLGATGTVGAIAVQAARLMGAARVVAAGRDPDGLRRAAALGADATVPLQGSVPELTEAFLEAAGGPLDVVLDPLWGEPASAAVEALAMRGRLVQLGQSAGAQASFSSVSVRFRELSILGYTSFASTPEEKVSALERMWGHAAAGELRAEYDTLPLADAGEAWSRQVAGPHRKIVVVP